MMYLPVDRGLDMEFGFWPQTIGRWVKEGFPKEFAEEIGEDMFHHRFEQFIGSDAGQKLEVGTMLMVPQAMNPWFTEEVLEEDEKTVVKRDLTGTVARWWKSGTGEASIPEYLEHPVTDRASWEKLKERYRLDDPTRRISDAAIAEARKAAAEGWSVHGHHCGFYGKLREWVGVENLSYLFYDDPKLVHDMCEHWARLAVEQLRALPDDVPIHKFSWWEDMCFNHGPLCSVEQFQEFIVPRYKMVMAEAKARGCTVCHLDCDGLIDALVPGWLESGINVMFPNEVAAGTDMYKLRKQYGKEARFAGGIDKREIAKGKEAIDREIDRIAPLYQDGGYIPFLDHLVPPDIGLADYLYYREKKKELIGKK
jgi:uroporphyrinogen decarboxylase